MAGASRPKGLLAIAAAFAVAGIVLAQQAWVSSPRVKVPPSVALIVAGILVVGAAMMALQAAGVERWNDLLAAVLLAGSTAELLWFTLGSAPPPRTCAIGLWQPPEAVCRAGLGVCTLSSAAMAAWAVVRFAASRKPPAPPARP